MPQIRRFTGGLIPSAAPTYVGPGNIVPGAIAWWGLRAYSAATAGNVAINLRRDSDDATQDFNTLLNGNLDVASIATFKGAANLFVTKLYDQTGNGKDAVQATAANQFPFTLSVLGSLPAIDNFASANSLSLVSSSITQAQPFAMSAVCYRITASTDRWLACSSDLQVQFDRSVGGNNDVGINAGVLLNTAGVSDGNWHALQMLYNSTASQIYADGASVITGDAGTNTLASAIHIGDTLIGALAYAGYIGEVGLWGADISSSFSPLNSNQHAYWVF